jgi:hypothetical protein
MSALIHNRTLAIHSLLCALLLTIVAFAHVEAFSLQSSIQPVQGIPGLGIPGQQQQQEQPATPPQQIPSPQQQAPPPQSPSFPPSSSTTPPPPLTQSSPVIPEEQQRGPNEGIIAHGFIDSLIFTPTATWIATGNWTIGVNNDNTAVVSSNMTWYNDNGTSSHTHEILNFRPFGQGEQQSILVQPEDNSVSLRGVLDVGANHRIAWNGVQSATDIKKGGKILSISLNDVQTNHHFGGRPIFGIVTSFTRCSDQPGPNMEILPPCLNIPILPPAPQPAVTAPPPSPAITAPVSPSPTTPANNTVQNPATSLPPVLPSTQPSMSNVPGNMTTAIRPPAVPNATGKSPFDILGGG